MVDENKDEKRPYSMTPQERPSYNEYIGKFLVISQTHDPREPYIGFVKDMNNKKIILNPFKGFEYDKEQKLNLNKLVKGDHCIEYDPRTKFNFRSTNEDTINEVCYRENKEILKRIEYKNLGLIRRFFKDIF